MTARWGMGFLLTFALLGAAAGLFTGRGSEGPLAQTGGNGTSESGSSGNGSSSGDGSSGGSDGSSTAPDGTTSPTAGPPRTTIPPSRSSPTRPTAPGQPTTPATPATTASPTRPTVPNRTTPPATAAPTPAPPVAPDDGLSGTSGDGSSGLSRGSGSGRGTRDTIPVPTTVAGAPLRIPQPTTTVPVPPNQVSVGQPTGCPANVPASIVCFRVTDASSRAVRVPNGAGGSVTLPLPPATGDAGTGSSGSVYNDVDLVVNVNVESGEVVEVERLPDNETTQAVFGTLAALLLVMIATACGAVGARRYWRGS